MMEEIDFLDQDLPNPFDEKPKPKPAPRNNNNTTSEPIRLPRTSGASRGTFLRDTLQSQIPTTEQLQNTKKQAGKLLKGFGNQLSKLNVGKLIDKMEQDQGLADSLEHLNMRMKEEVERQEVRREAEELTLKLMTEHLNGFLVENPLGTYEEWIQDFHPENANQGKLLSDIQQIDERFYVMESDHRRLWNDVIEKQEEEKSGHTNDKTSYAHRLVEARTQIWGKAPGVSPDKMSKNRANGEPVDFLDGNPNPTNHAPPIDLLGDSYTHSTTPASHIANGIEEFDIFAPTPIPATNDDSGEKLCVEAGQNGSKKDDPLQDLFQF